MFVRIGDCMIVMIVIQQGVYCFLQYMFFVMYDDVWCSQIQQMFQMVVMVNDVMIQIVQVRSCEMIIIQWNQWMQIWWQYWQNGQDYLFWFVIRLNECFQQFDTFGQFFTFGFGVGFVQFFMQLFVFLFQIYVFQQSLDCFCFYFCVEFVIEFFQCVQILFFSQDLLMFQVGYIVFDNYIGFKVQYVFDIVQWYIEQQIDMGWQ